MADDSVPVSRIARRALDRMKNATIKVERMATSSLAEPKRRGAPVQGGRWIKIKNGSGGKYSWIAVKLGDDGRMVEDADWGQGDHTKEGGFAVEVKYRSKFVPDGSIVWASPGPGRDCLLFEYEPGILVARLAPGVVITRRQDSGGTSRPGSGMVELSKVNDGANPDIDSDDEFEGSGTMVKVFNWSRTAIGSTEAKPVLIQFGASGRFWLVGDEC